MSQPETATGDRPESITKRLLASRILIIDDEPLVIDVLRSHLNDVGFWNIIGVSDPIAAVKRVLRDDPDLIIIDISMPDVSGNYLIEVARSEPALAKVPILVVTSDHSEETRLRAIGLGADAVIYKPVPAAVLLGHVQPALEYKLLLDESKARKRKKRFHGPVKEKYQRLRSLAGRAQGMNASS